VQVIRSSTADGIVVSLTFTTIFHLHTFSTSFLSSLDLHGSHGFCVTFYSTQKKSK
jgi:hypothetical protein